MAMTTVRAGRQRNKEAAAAKVRGQQLVISRRAQQARPLESVIEVSDIDAVLQRAAEKELLHGDDAEGAEALTAGLGSGLVDLDGTGATAEERRLLREEQEALHADSLRNPASSPQGGGVAIVVFVLRAGEGRLVCFRTRSCCGEAARRVVHVGLLLLPQRGLLSISSSTALSAAQRQEKRPSRAEVTGGARTRPAEVEVSESSCLGSVFRVRPGLPRSAHRPPRLLPRL